MTPPWHRLRAHDRSSLARSKHQQLVERFRKLPGFHVIGIAAKSCVAPESVVRIATNFATSTERGEMSVANSLLGEAIRKILLIEVRIAC